MESARAHNPSLSLSLFCIRVYYKRDPLLYTRLLFRACAVIESESRVMRLMVFAVMPVKCG